MLLKVLSMRLNYVNLTFQVMIGFFSCKPKLNCWLNFFFNLLFLFNFFLPWRWWASNFGLVFCHWCICSLHLHWNLVRFTNGWPNRAKCSWNLGPGRRAARHFVPSLLVSNTKHPRTYLKTKLVQYLRIKFTYILRLLVPIYCVPPSSTTKETISSFLPAY